MKTSKIIAGITLILIATLAKSAEPKVFHIEQTQQAHNRDVAKEVEAALNGMRANGMSEDLIAVNRASLMQQRLKNAQEGFSVDGMVTIWNEVSEVRAALDVNISSLPQPMRHNVVATSTDNLTWDVGNPESAVLVANPTSRTPLSILQIYFLNGEMNKLNAAIANLPSDREVVLKSDASGAPIGYVVKRTLTTTAGAKTVITEDLSKSGSGWTMNFYHTDGVLFRTGKIEPSNSVPAPWVSIPISHMVIDSRNDSGQGQAFAWDGEIPSQAEIAAMHSKKEAVPANIFLGAGLASVVGGVLLVGRKKWATKGDPKVQAPS